MKRSVEWVTSLAMSKNGFFWRLFPNRFLKRAVLRAVQPILNMPISEEMLGKDFSSLMESIHELCAKKKSQLEDLSTDQQKLSAILAAMEEGVVAVDDQEDVVHMNKACGDIMNVDPLISMGRKIWEVSRISDLNDLVTRVFKTKTAHKKEVALFTAKGDQIIRLNAVPIQGGNQQWGVLVVMDDITELRKLETVRRDFVANVSHELKTPVTVIRGLAETILDDPVMEAAQQKSFLEKIKDQALRLSDLVTDLLTLSRIESNRPFSDLKILDLRDVVQTAYQNLLPSAQLKKQNLELFIQESPMKVHAEAEGLRQIVDNLVSNAIKYTPEGGSVCVELHTQDGVVTLKVKDTGIGLAADDCARVFERFYRVDKSRSQNQGSTGLGLAIVKHLTYAFGGTVGVESSLGSGSTFWVTLPLVS